MTTTADNNLTLSVPPGTAADEHSNNDRMISSNNNNNIHGPNSILASKVSRALEVRSDTPAMKAALDALAHLPDHQDDLFTVDSRSVRVAIEQDALHQALLLQDELKQLLRTVTDLRKGVSETAAVARRVDEVVHSNVVSMGRGVGTAHDGMTTTTTLPDVALPQPPSLPSSGSDAALEQEQRLAAVLSDCFARRDLARRRVEAVQEFLDRFDLSEEDSRLLDHYAFEDVETSNVNGIAFLTALERVRTIRTELGRTFGPVDVLHQKKQARRPGQEASASLVGLSSDVDRLGASSALRMMETLAQKQERAYERLYHWLQKYLHLHSHEQHGVPSVVTVEDDRFDEALSHPFVRRSLRTLRNVPAFYSHLLELIAQSRRSEETRRFLLALTSGYAGLPPIEMRAHDSVVYVGDMLAFCFRAFSVEADVAKGLLNFQPEGREDGDGNDDDDDDDDPDERDGDVHLAEEDPDYHVVDRPMSAVEMLYQSMGGLARPLKSRVSQVVSSLARRPGLDDDDDAESDDGMDDLEEEGTSARAHLAQLYEICGLLLFYASALDKAIRKLSSVGGGDDRGRTSTTSDADDDERNPLVACILDCLADAAKAYEASLRVYGAMLEQIHLLTGESEASLAHAMVVKVVEVRRASPGFVDDVDCPAEYRQILSLDWSCEVLVEAALPACKTLDDIVTLKQSISVARQGNLADTVMKSLNDRLHEKETSLVDVLVEKETTDVLDLCGLGTLIVAWERFQGVRVEGMTMATYPGLTPDEVEGAMREFYSSLYSPPIPSFENTIKDPTLRKLARTKIARSVCDRYTSLYEEMIRPDPGGYDDLSFLGHTPQQVHTLFTV
jgi:hypothetical protein